MAERKTRQTRARVADFLNGIEDRQTREDCRAVAKMMRDATGRRARMWGSAIVGYDRYHYRYASGRSGTFMMTGFSPRARNIAIYIMPGFDRFGGLLEKLGKHETGKSCLYIRRLSDVDERVLARLIDDSVKEMRRKYG